MNANTALKINDAVAQAIECGENVADIRSQVERAISQAVIQTTEKEIDKLNAVVAFHRRTLSDLRQ